MPPLHFFHAAAAFSHIHYSNNEPTARRRDPGATVSTLCSYSRFEEDEKEE
jgi:hypothetical protein